MLVACCAALVGACGDDRAAVVPPRPTSGTTPIATVTSPSAPAFRTVEGTRLPEGTTTTRVDDAPIGFGGFELRGYAAVDGDHDGDDDLVIALVSTGELAVGYARRDGTRFEQSILARAGRDPACTVGDAVIRILAPDLGVVEQRLQCGAGAGVDIVPVTLGAVARAPERATVRAPVDDPFIASLTVVPSASDADHDGASDLALAVSTTARGASRTETESLLVRVVASGMVPELAAVGTRVATLERSARRDLETQPARASRDASRAATLALAVCPETGAPSVRFVGSANTGCGGGDRHVRALATWAAALARTNHADASAAMLFAFAARGIRLDPASERSIARALAASPARRAPQYTTFIVPELSGARALAFDASGALVVRAAADVRMVLGASPTITPLAEGDPAAPLLRANVAPADAGPGGPSLLRFGETLVAMRSGAAKLVGLPAIDGGSFASVALDDAGRHVACIVDGQVRVAEVAP